MTPRKKLPSVERLNELFDYKDGQLIRKIRTANRTKIGDVAGCLGNTGYLEVYVDRSRYLQHRVIYKMMTGEEYDHIHHTDNDKTNNRIDNLMPVSNGLNIALSPGKGFTFHKATNKYQARIQVEGNTKQLGLYDCPLMARVAFEDAHAAQYGSLSPFYITDK